MYSRLTDNAQWKELSAGIADAVGYADGGPNYLSEVSCANGTLRFSEHGEKFVRVGKGEKWQDVPFEDPPAEMLNQRKAFAESIELDIEPPVHGAYGRHIMEIMFTAEQSAISGREVMLESGQSWLYQEQVEPVTIHHGWV